MDNDGWFVWINPANASITYSARLSAITKIMEFRGRFPEVYTLGSETGLPMHPEVVGKLKAKLAIPQGLS